MYKDSNRIARFESPAPWGQLPVCKSAARRGEGSVKAIYVSQCEVSTSLTAYIRRLRESPENLPRQERPVPGTVDQRGRANIPDHSRSAAFIQQAAHTLSIAHDPHRAQGDSDSTSRRRRRSRSQTPAIGSAIVRAPTPCDASSRAPHTHPCPTTMRASRIERRRGSTACPAKRSAFCARRSGSSEAWAAYIYM